MFQTPSAGRWVLQRDVEGGNLQGGHAVSNPISGEVGAAAHRHHPGERHDHPEFQTPSAGRWVLQPPLRASHRDLHGRFKPHQRGGGCCSTRSQLFALRSQSWFQTPSAGRWVLQQVITPNSRKLVGFVSNPISGEVGAAALWSLLLEMLPYASFKPHQRGGGCCSGTWDRLHVAWSQVSNPISGEVGAAAVDG